MSKNKKIKLDEFHYHEAIDRTYVVQSNIENTLQSHPVFHKHKKLAKKLDKVQTLLRDLYQEIGNVTGKKFN
jgi:hypothetical protein